MSNVKVAADDNGLFFIQIFEISAEKVFPSHSTFEPFEIMGIWDVNIDEKEIFKVESDNAPFGIEIFDANAAREVFRLNFGENRGTGVPFFISVVPKLIIAVQIENSFAILHFNFLQCENIGVEGIESGHKVIF